MATSQLKNQISERKAASESLKQSGPSRNIKDLIKMMEPEIKKALPTVITPERFTRMALTALSNQPKLAECTERSFLGALMNAAQLGLEPNTPLGQAYLIPYYNNSKKQMEAQFQIGYKGLIELAHRSGEFSNLYAMEVYENDYFEYEYGYDMQLKHKPAMSNRGEVIFYYAVYRFVNGGGAFVVMSVDDIKRFAARFSESYKKGFGPWKDNFDEMAKKTVIKKLLKHAPIKAEFARNLQQDQTVKSEISDDMSSVHADIMADEYEYVDDETGEVLSLSEEDGSTPFDN